MAKKLLIVQPSKVDLGSNMLASLSGRYLISPTLICMHSIAALIDARILIAYDFRVQSGPTTADAQARPLRGNMQETSFLSKLSLKIPTRISNHSVIPSGPCDGEPSL
jgi:hypothetical protein